LWDVATGELRRTFPEAPNVIKSLAFAPDGKTLVTASGDWPGRVCLWDTASGRMLQRGPVEPSRLFQVAFAPDGKTVAVAGVEPALGVWEAATCHERRRLTGLNGEVRSVAFSPDGKRLAAAAGDTSVLIWNVAVAQRPRSGQSLSADKLEALWSELAGSDAERAYRAMKLLATVPEQAVAFLSQRLPTVPELPREQVERALNDLDHDRYQVRHRATQELERLGDLAEPFLRQRLVTGSSPEVSRRVELLLRRLQAPLLTPEQVRALRALEALEWIGTRQVRPLLEAHAQGAPTARLRREAQAALERLEKKAR
jgi:hypothetical protein